MNIVWGDGSRLWLRGMTLRTFHYLAPTIPESVYCTFQLTFAIITAALICGSFADRMKVSPQIIQTLSNLSVKSLTPHPISPSNLINNSIADPL